MALDAVMARMMGVDPARLRFLARARELGLGDYREEAIRLEGELLPIPEFKVPPLGEDALKHLRHIQRLLEERSASRPEADPARCTSCGTCVEQCPAGALSLERGLPVVDAAACIACYCCQEMCPEKAISLSADREGTGRG